MGNGGFGYHVLRTIRPPGAMSASATGTDGMSYAETMRRGMGEDWAAGIADKTVVDFGCGGGRGSIELARHGARRVIGIDIRPEVLEVARTSAEQAKVSDRCTFETATSEAVDLVVSLDAFEHFDDPGGVLGLMHGMLRPGGGVFVSFGPTWYHPRGGHLFSIFPWSHLLFSERAQIRWRADFKHDGATCFREVSGGLNQMTIGRFKKLAEASDFRIVFCKLVPIRPLRWLHNRVTREFTTSLVNAYLVRRDDHR